MNRKQLIKLLFLLLTFCSVTIPAQNDKKSFLSFTETSEEVPLIHAKSMQQILTQIESQIKNGDPLDKIFSILDDLKSQIKFEQNRHDQVKTNYESQCDQEIQLRTKEIDESSALLKTSQMQLDNCQMTKTQNEHDKTTNENLQDVTQQNINSIQRQRENDQLVYDKIQSDHVAVLQSIKEALQLLSEFFNNGNSQPELLAQVSTTMFKNSLSLKNQKSFMPIMNLLVQLTYDQIMDDDAVETIKRFFINLKDNLRDSMSDFQDKNNKEIQVFEQTFDNLNNTLNQLITNIQNLEASLSDMNQCIGKYSQIVNSAEQRIENNQNLLNSVNQMCDSFMLEYNNSKEARNNELNFIEKVKQIIEQRYNDLSKNVVMRAKQEEQEWEQYKNDYEYKPPEKQFSIF